MTDWEDYVMLLGAAASGGLAVLRPDTPWYVPLILAIAAKAGKDVRDYRAAKKS